jgi:MSHA biogenesis protein MshP
MVMKRCWSSTTFLMRTRRNSSLVGNRRKQRGIGLPVAIFVITVIAAFVVNMSYLIQDNATGRSEQVQTARARMIAESATHLALTQLFPPSAYPGYASTSCSNVSSPSGLDSDDGMAGCSVTVTCSSSGTTPNIVYSITSVGVCDDATQTITASAM